MLPLCCQGNADDYQWLFEHNLDHEMSQNQIPCKYLQSSVKDIKDAHTKGYFSKGQGKLRTKAVNCE